MRHLALLVAGAGWLAAPLSAWAEVRELLQTYCFTCHSPEEQKGELDLQSADIYREPRVWEQALDQIELGEMPPKKAKQMTSEEKAALTGWIRKTLDDIALSRAGDPGPVVLRRLSNMEYTYTLRDLTGVESLDPALEFPVDGAAGEGFTNAGAALVMSPSLFTKYLDAAKEVAAHAVFTPYGFRWSASTSPQDWTDETLAAIRELYHRYTTSGKGMATVLQGVELDTGTGEGRLPVADYVEALQGRRSRDGLSPKYLDRLRAALEDTSPSWLLDPLRAKYQTGRLTAADIEPWQSVLWKFNSVGHAGRDGAPTRWQQPVSPVAASQELRVKLSGQTAQMLYLVSTPVEGTPALGEVVWENARLSIPGLADVPVAHLPELLRHLEAERARLLGTAEESLRRLADGAPGEETPELAAWRDYLGLQPLALEPLLTDRVTQVQNYAAVQGWVGPNALSVLANASDETFRIPGLMQPHSVAAHPAPDRAAVIAWQSPVTGTLRISGLVMRAHPECGPGVTWSVEVRRGQWVERLGEGVARDGSPIAFGPFEDVRVERGHVVALVIGPHQGEHTCGLTTVNLTLSDGAQEWDLAGDVSSHILASNPHGPWHFLSQPAAARTATWPPAVAAWLRECTPERAAAVREELEKNFPLTHPLLAHAWRRFKPSVSTPPLKVAAGTVSEVTIPPLGAEVEFVVTARPASPEVAVQVQVSTEPPASSTPELHPDLPVLAAEGGAARQRVEAGFDAFRELFPIALCYTRIVPVDEVVTLTLFYREDDHLSRLMLSDAEKAELDRLWEELLFVSEAPLKQVDAYEQLVQYATQDRLDLVEEFARIGDRIRQAAEAFKAQQEAAVAAQAQAVIDFAALAWRRPLRSEEEEALRAFEPRLMLARVLASPSFLYKIEERPEETGPVNDWEIATRLSYFLWSSVPDEELRALAAAGRLRDPDVLAAQARRMLKSAKIARLATEFGCQWLHVRDVATLDEKSERHFPTFTEVREAMQEEVVRFFTDLLQENRPILTLLNADYTFLNGPLAAHYGLEWEGGEGGWRRVDGWRARGRGGILGFAATLAKHSGASRTSAILRGTWLSEVVLGDKLPAPPKGVPTLPDEPPEGLTERQLIERHSSDPNCAACHKRIDPYGFALEGFDAIGRAREADTASELYDGTRVEGLEGLREYLLSRRRKDFIEQFCRKLLGYALGRSVQLSDRPLLESMAQGDLHVASLVEAIVRSRQFREIRGKNQELVSH